MSSLLDDYKENIEGFDIGRFFRTLLLQSKTIILLTTLGLILGIYLYLNTTKEYKINSMLQVYSGSQNQLFNSNNTSTFLNPVAGGDINLLFNLYKTRSNIIQIIEEFNLNLLVDENTNGRKYISSINIENLGDNDSVGFYIKFNESNFDFINSDEITVYSGPYDILHTIENISIEIKKPTNNTIDIIKYTYLNPSLLVSYYSSILSVQTTTSGRFGSNEGILNTSIITSDIELGKKILNYANNVFIENSIKAETEKAQKAIIFIDEQLDSLEGILKLKKLNLKNFKEDNQSINVDLEIQSIIETISNIEEKINTIDIELAEASTLYTSTNPILKTLNERKQALLNQRFQIEKRIKNLPLAEQEYIDLFRDVEISQELYINLTNRKLGFEIQEASTLGNIRVVDDAYMQYQTNPRILSIIIISVIFFVLGIIIAFIRATFFMSITNPAEIFDAGIKNKIYGVVPLINGEFDGDDIFLDQSIQRSFESLLLNIELDTNVKNKRCKLISITSPTENNGKSVISRSLAKILSQKGKKTLLIDNDLIRGDQHKSFGVNKISNEEFNEISLSTLDNIKVDEYLYLIPKISKLKDSFNFLYSQTYVDRLADFQEYFDYIIFDTAPVLSVSDSSILMSLSDLNFLIVRHGNTKLNQIRQSFFMAEQINEQFNGIIYNGYSKPQGYYGYYNLYGDYRYQYYAEKYLYDDYEYTKNN